MLAEAVEEAVGAMVREILSMTDNRVQTGNWYNRVVMADIRVQSGATRCVMIGSEMLRHIASRLLSLQAIRFAFQGLVLAAITAACVPPPPRTPQEAFREVAPPALDDDLNLTGLTEALELQLGALKGSPDVVMRFGAETITRAAYATALEDLLHLLRSSNTTADKLEYIRAHFRFFELLGSDRSGQVLLTSYFEPVIPGGKHRSSKFSRALLAAPPDLVTIPLAQFSERFADEKPLKGRVHNSKVVPYFTREEIDGKFLLRGRDLELAWTDPIDGFFLQIQGSGTVTYPDGSEEHLVYADKNGHKYEAIGRFLKEQIAPEPVTMQRIERLLRSMSKEDRDAILFRNPSYVFFSKSSRRAITALGVPATPGRTIATDPRITPKGALAFLEFKRPHFSSATPTEENEPAFTPAARFVVDQDTGGAITGAGRVDLFWGRGNEAKRSAGIIQHPARIVYLAPR